MLAKITSRLKAVPILILFIVTAGASFWGATQIPAPTVHYLLKQDYITQAELWKRRVLTHLEDGVEAFKSNSLTPEEVSFLSLVPEASDVYRFKLFDSDGNVFWSTRADDIGTANTKPYFQEVIAKGEVYAKRDEKDPSEVDGLQIHAIDTSIQDKHVIYEVYVPIAENGIFVGAIEFYTDATTVHKLTLRRVEIAVSVVAALLTLMITATAWILLKSTRYQMRAIKLRSEEEREFITKQMQLAREVQLLGDLNEWLQSSKSLSELFDMVARFMSHLLPESEGTIYVYSNSRDVLDGSASWNGGEYKPHIHPEGCWGLRRGRTYEFGRHEVNFVCEHAEPHDDRPYFCFPILAHGETVGLMHLRKCQEISVEEFYASKKLAQMCAEQISMAIANVRMRDQLEEQSTRDPLTGLFNRRFMMDKLRRILDRYGKRQEPVTLIYMDVDHFKKFNDNHGHDAGDIVLRSVADVMSEACDGDDIACRMGGEEFMLIWPGAQISEIAARVEKLRQDVEALRVPYNEKHLPTVTISAGVTQFPEGGKDVQELLRQADEALYRSKDNGRNQVSYFNKTTHRKLTAAPQKPNSPTSVAAE